MESIVLQETTLKEKTVLDYRDFLETSFHDRSRSTCVFSESFVNETGIHALTEGDFEELGHHCHSDISSEVDDDPVFEYN